MSPLKNTSPIKPCKPLKTDRITNNAKAPTETPTIEMVEITLIIPLDFFPKRNFKAI
jgi:hypothetical protein